MCVRETSGTWVRLCPQNCNAFACHFGISLFVIIFSLRLEITYLTAQQWEREGWEMHQRNRVLFFRGEKQVAWFCHLIEKQKQKVIAVELELGKGRNNSWDVGYHRRLWGTRRGFAGFVDEERLCLYCHIDFVSPNNHILSVFWSARFSTDDAGS